MIDPTVWNSIILRITAEQYHFLNRELGITKAKLKLPTLQDVSELIDGLASIAFYEFNNEHQRTARADLALNLVWLFTTPGKSPCRTILSALAPAFPSSA